MAAPDSPAPEYVPAVYVDPEKVDSVKGGPWHLAAHDPELYPGIKKGDGSVLPMTVEAFAKKQADSKPE